MNTKLYLARHGETEWNVVHRMQGFKDSPLTDLGKQQAEWLRSAMDTVPIDVIYASSSPRALQTAQIVRGDREIPLEISEAFIEMGFGIWEGRLQSEVQTEYPEQWDHFWNNPDKFEIESSETYAGMQARVIDKLQDILNNHAGQSILIVTHTVIIKLLMVYFEGKEMKQLWSPPEIHPTSLSRIDIADNVPKVVLHGDISHYQ
ncbi:histidine phosphatase family protein [Paenibacillus sp. NPDC058174]|uniref:histidine phosphatase family protein n=1 Tax=Paenibacillus sp. NPDC058174 TaxID=3346366 RepID=UPI0036DE170D